MHPEQVPSGAKGACIALGLDLPLVPLAEGFQLIGPENLHWADLGSGNGREAASSKASEVLGNLQIAPIVPEEEEWSSPPGPRSIHHHTCSHCPYGTKVKTD